MDSNLGIIFNQTLNTNCQQLSYIYEQANSFQRRQHFSSHNFQQIINSRLCYFNPPENINRYLNFFSVKIDEYNISLACTIQFSTQEVDMQNKIRNLGISIINIQYLFYNINNN
ncbi:unnamed protein product [Paramecium sonneborni]|uniref:Uncharacterized protein n=1 Tax=Paramecium sonneborni TaxID=65129 RepID=A0A8S1P0A0_9CILI|nr:unnamed protein product [Paramecium sonneborni]